MSRKVSKIFVICALVAIVPLMIVGTALAAFYSLDATVFVEAVIDQDIAESAKNDANFARVACKDVSKDSFKVVAGRNQSAEVRADYAPNAYVFKGWFQGSKTEYQAAKSAGEVEFISTDTAYTFKPSAVANLVAAYEAVKFDITYTYTESDTARSTTTVQALNIVYGDALLDLKQYETEQRKFIGWKIEGDASSSIYDTATFDRIYSKNAVANTQKLTLVDSWDVVAPNQVLIKFYDYNNRLISTQKADKDSTFVLGSVESVLQALGKTDLLVEGYTYYWTNESGEKVEPSSIVVNGDRSFYLRREENKVTYTVTYYDLNRQVISTAKVDKNATFTIQSVEDVLRAAGKLGLMEEGYTYYWTDEAGRTVTESSVVVQSNRSFYLARKENQVVYSITYYDLNKQVISTTKVNKGSTYQIQSVEDVLRAAGKLGLLEEGYTYYWTNELGGRVNPSSVVVQTNYKFYLTKKENPVTYSVTYYDLNKQVISTAKVNKNATYTIQSVEDVLRAAGKENLLEAGYTYFWADAQGQKVTPSTIVVDGNKNYYLNRTENQVSYAVTFYDLNNAVISTTKVNKNSTFTIGSVEDVLRAAGKLSLLEDGYTYFWADAQGQKVTQSSIVVSADTNFYLKRTENKVTYTVTYYDLEGSVITTSTVDKNTYLTLDSVENVLKAAGKEYLLAKGYAYSWVDARGAAISSFTVTSDTNIYLHKELISYNAVLLASEDGIFNGKENITFNVESNAKTLFADWLNAEKWTMKYTFWKFDGIKFGNKVYNTQNISSFVSDFLAKNSTSKTAQFVVNTHKYFTTVSVKSQITAKARASKSSHTFNNNVYTSFGYSNEIAFQVSRTNGLESIESINSFLGIDSEKLYTKINNNKTEVKLFGIVVYTSAGEEVTITNLEDFATMNDLIEQLLLTKQVELGEVFAITGLQMLFEPVV